MSEIPNVPSNWPAAAEALQMGVEDSVDAAARIADNAAENIMVRLNDYGFRVVPFNEGESGT